MLNAKNFGSHIKMHENFAAISNTYPWNIHLIEKKGPLNSQSHITLLLLHAISVFQDYRISQGSLYKIHIQQKVWCST